MPSLVDRFTALDPKTKSVTTFSTTLLFAFVLFFSMSQYMGCRSEAGMEPYAKSQALIDGYMDSLRKPPPLDVKYFNMFKTQQKLLTLRKGHYLQMGEVFFKNYYSVVVLLMVFSCIGGVLLFLIANQGWAQTGPVLRALFLAMALLIAFFGLFPSVFDQKENFDANMKQYMNYTKAELGIVDQLSKLDNPLFAIRTDSIDPTTKARVRWLDSARYYYAVDSMITANNTVINGLTNYILSIDAEQIKSPSDFAAVISGYLQARKDSVPRKHP